MKVRTWIGWKIVRYKIWEQIEKIREGILIRVHKWKKNLISNCRLEGISRWSSKHQPMVKVHPSRTLSRNVSLSSVLPIWKARVRCYKEKI